MDKDLSHSLTGQETIVIFILLQVLVHILLLVIVLQSQLSAPVKLDQLSWETGVTLKKVSLSTTFALSRQVSVTTTLRLTFRLSLSFGKQLWPIVSVSTTKSTLKSVDNQDPKSWS